MMSLTYAFVIALSALCITVSCKPISSFKAEPPIIASCKFDLYIALGDSYSAGNNAGNGTDHGRLPLCEDPAVSTSLDYHNPLITTCASEQCEQNSASYPYQFYQEHKDQFTSFDFLACNNANTTTCAAEQLHATGNETQDTEPNASKDGPNTLVTITIGGNNGDAFTSVVRDCVFGRTSADGCAETLNSSHTRVQDFDPQEIADFFDTLRQKFPTSQVVVFAYPDIWPDAEDMDACQSEYLGNTTMEERGHMNELLDMGNGILKDAAEEKGFLFVDPNDDFVGHRLCDISEPYIQWDVGVTENGTTEDWGGDGYNSGILHPTEQGHRVFVDALERALACS